MLQAAATWFATHPEAALSTTKALIVAGVLIVWVSAFVHIMLEKRCR